MSIIRHRKNFASYQSRFCYDREALMRYKFGEIKPEERAKIFRHLDTEQCERCQEIYFMLTLDTEEEPESYPEIPADYRRNMLEKLSRKTPKIRSFPTPLRLKKGQIWTTVCNPRDRKGQCSTETEMAIPVLVMAPGDGEKTLENEIEVIPISLDTGFHTEGEDIVLNENSPTGYPVLLEIWNRKSMLAGNLGECRGSVGDDILTHIEAIHQKTGHEISDPELKEWRDRERNLTEYLIADLTCSDLPDEKKIEHEISNPEISDSTAAKVIVVTFTILKIMLSAAKRKGKVRGKEVQRGGESEEKKHFRIGFKPERNAHLYILHLDSTGNIKIIFSDPVPAELDSFPEKADYTKGEDKLYVLALEKPLDDLEQRVREFNGKGTGNIENLFLVGLRFEEKEEGCLYIAVPA